MDGREAGKEYFGRGSGNVLTLRIHNVRKKHSDGDGPSSIYTCSRGRAFRIFIPLPTLWLQTFYTFRLRFSRRRAGFCFVFFPFCNFRVKKKRGRSTRRVAFLQSSYKSSLYTEIGRPLMFRALWFRNFQYIIHTSSPRNILKIFFFRKYNRPRNLFSFIE